MKKTPLVSVLSALLMLPLLGGAAPTPGGADLTPPGSWTNQFSWYCGFWMGDGLTYRIYQNWTANYGPDITGQWDLIQLYNGSQLSLSNAPGAPWYCASDTNVSFEIDLPALWVKSRSRSGPASTNGYLEMEASAHAGRFIFLATYAGTPAITNVPETPDELPYISKSGSLSSARFCVGYLPDDPRFATNARPTVSIRGVAAGSPQVELRWNTLSNRLYQVQYRPDLNSGDWADLGSPLSGTGMSRAANDVSTSDTAQRFYRVLEFP